MKDDRDLLHAFSRQDLWERKPLGKRFAQWLSQQDKPDPLKEIALFEAAVCHAPAADAASLTLAPVSSSPALWTLAKDVVILPTSQALLEHLQMTGEDPKLLPYLALRRDASGEVAILRLDAHVGASISQLRDASKSEDLLNMNENELATLIAHKLLVPASWALVKPHVIHKTFPMEES